jgi:hypothetical protein
MVTPLELLATFEMPLEMSDCMGRQTAVTVYGLLVPVYDMEQVKVSCPLVHSQS